MPSPTDRFTRLQKIAIFLIVMGPDKAREILGDLGLDTIESINTAMQALKNLTPQEKAATMIEFGDFFYKDKPLSAKLKEPQPSKKAAAKKPEAKPGAAKKVPPVLAAAELDEKPLPERSPSSKTRSILAKSTGVRPATTSARATRARTIGRVSPLRFLPDRVPVPARPPQK